MSGVGGLPTWKKVEESNGSLVVVSSFNSSGDYVFSGTPSSYPVALVFMYSVGVNDYDVMLDFYEKH